MQQSFRSTPVFHRTSRLAAALAVALALPATASAQQQDPAKDLDQVLVTATRTAGTADEALAAVEVIDRAQIEGSAARSLPELLRGRAGIALVNQGGLGKVGTLFLRGTESDHVLVLVDGVRVGSATSGLASLQDIPLEQVERIEIVRGPRSSLYGADAIGGVIQLFTRRGSTAAGVHGRARIGAGSHGLREASAGLDLRGARGGVGVDLGYQATDGIDSCRGIGAPRYAGCGMDAPDPDRDGYRNRSASLRADFAPGDAWAFAAHGLRARGRNAYDADPAWGLPDTSEVVQQVVGGSARYRRGEALTLRLSAGRNTDASDNYVGAAYVDRFESTRDSASLQADLLLAPGQALSLGLDWLRDRGRVEGAYSAFAASRGNRAGFAQYQGRAGRSELQASLRRDDNDQFGGKTTGGLAIGRELGDGWRLVASHATAFKAPSFNELYYPYYGNPALRPESSGSSELSLRLARGGWDWQLAAYRTRIHDLITYDTALMAANNIERARIDGVELTASGHLAGWAVRVQAGTLDARNRAAGANRGNRLPRRPARSARLDLDRRLGALGLGLSGIAEGARWDDVANGLRVGGYATVDARASWTLGRDWTLQASVVNAFDRRYETSAYYRQPGREFALALRWQPR